MFEVNEHSPSHPLHVEPVVIIEFAVLYSQSGIDQIWSDILQLNGYRVFATCGEGSDDFTLTVQ
ncbi:hypothetical protein D3C76_1683100 [compost metagenome]